MYIVPFFCIFQEGNGSGSFGLIYERDSYTKCYCIKFQTRINKRSNKRLYALNSSTLFTAGWHKIKCRSNPQPRPSNTRVLKPSQWKYSGTCNDMMCNTRKLYIHLLLKVDISWLKHSHSVNFVIKLFNT